MYRVFLWGMGNGYNLFTALHGNDMVNVIGVVDSENRNIKKIDGIPVDAPEILRGRMDYDYLIICVDNECTYIEIFRQALSYGIKKEIIIPLRVFKIPFFNFDDYINILRSDVSIVLDSCFAGFLYHRFAMRFLSPTINMGSPAKRGDK